MFLIWLRIVIACGFLAFAITFGAAAFLSEWDPCLSPIVLGTTIPLATAVLSLICYPTRDEIESARSRWRARRAPPRRSPRQHYYRVTFK